MSFFRGPVSHQVKCDISRNLFNAEYRSGQDPDWESYYAYFDRELRHLAIGVASCQPYNILQSHHDIIHVHKIIKSNKHNPKHEVRRLLRGYYAQAEDNLIESAIDLTVRLWLMVNVRSQTSLHRMPQKLSVAWDNSASLTDLVGSLFQPSRQPLDPSRSRLVPLFTAWSMSQLCGLQIRWTDSLEDHLRLDLRAKELWIFPFKVFLLKHMEMQEKGGENKCSVFPKGLLQETITTLNLLFPHWDPNTQNFLSTQNQTFHAIPPFAGPRRLDLNEFDYWRDQLTELYERVYLAPADSWRQLWADRRNPHQWWTFWVAVVVLVLSVISCAASVIQAWASMKALNLQLTSDAA
ncbi:hypothetical protein PG984_013183 [Apiospora sp. TS-2023a]